VQIGVDLVTSYELTFPDYLDGYEHETESKGYLVDVKIVLESGTIGLTIYDRVRLQQDLDDEMASDGCFAAANLLVVPAVTRESISLAVERLSTGGFHGYLVSPST
jgi:hypothetical protein